MKNIDDFVDKLVREKGFDTKDPEILAQIKTDLMDRIEKRVNAMIMSNMPEDKLSQFGEVLDTEDQEKISKYVREQIPDIDEKTASVLLSFATTYTS